MTIFKNQRPDDNKAVFIKHKIKTVIESLNSCKYSLNYLLYLFHIIGTYLPEYEILEK